MSELEEELESGVDLTYYLQIFIHRIGLILAVFLATVISATVNVYMTRPMYAATALVLIEKEQRPMEVGQGGVMVETTADDYYQTQYRLVKSKSVLQKAYDSLNLAGTEDFGGGVGALEGAVSVVPIKNSRLVDINAESHVPELAASVANAVAKAYVNQNIENKLFISKEILQALYIKKSAIPDQSVAGAGDTPDQGLSYDSLPAVVKNPVIIHLRATLAGLETHLGEISTRYTGEHPEIIRLKSEIQAVRKSMDEETSRIVDSVKAELSGQLLGNNIRIIDPAEIPGGPYKPNRRRTITMAAFIGIFIGYLLALGLDLMDQTIRTQNDVESKLRLPFLGAVPKSVLEGDSSRSYGQLLKGPESLTGEAIRNIRTMIGFAAAGMDMRCILMTSTTPAEGKSFLSICLATVFAQLGEKVLLIEGDLRKPELYKRFAVSKELGLSHFLAHGKDVNEIPYLVQETDMQNLQVLVCGPTPPNPAELLSTPRVKAIIDWARTKYHRIVIDGPPIYPITDSLLWAKWSDSIVFVVKFGGAHANLVKKACQKLREGGFKIAGAIINQVTKRGAGYGEYYYYYNYSGYAGKP